MVIRSPQTSTKQGLLLRKHAAFSSSTKFVMMGFAAKSPSLVINYIQALLTYSVKHGLRIHLFSSRNVIVACHTQQAIVHWSEKFYQII